MQVEFTVEPFITAADIIIGMPGTQVSTRGVYKTTPKNNSLSSHFVPQPPLITSPCCSTESTLWHSFEMAPTSISFPLSPILGQCLRYLVQLSPS